MTRVAVIGSGNIGRRHLTVLKRLPSVQPLAVPVREARVPELLAEEFEVARDIGEARQQGCTHCVVATDTGRHFQDAIAAAENGMDLLVEKPLSVDAGEAAALQARVATAGQQLFVGCVLRFSESLNTFRELQDRIGRPHSARIEFQSHLPGRRRDRPYQESYSARVDEGGVLRDLIHEIDYAGWLLGWPGSVQAKLRNLDRLGIGAEETATLLWETKSGWAVTMTLDYLSRPARRRMRVAGEFGTIEWDGIEQSVTLALTGKPVEVRASEQTRDEMLLAQDRAFVEGSGDDSFGPMAKAEGGVRALSVCDAARRASNSGSEETVRYR